MRARARGTPHGKRAQRPLGLVLGRPTRRKRATDHPETGGLELDLRCSGSFGMTLLPLRAEAGACGPKKFLFKRATSLLLSKV